MFKLTIIIAALGRKSPHFIAQKVPLTYLQKLTTGPYFEPDESSFHPHTSI
jgi:hypothetical protein